MLTFLKEIFTWWNRQTLGTRIRTLIKGTLKGTKRIFSCHPIKFLGGGEGFDPVKKKGK